MPVQQRRPRLAMVRDLSPAFSHALSMEAHRQPLDLELAAKQHRQYHAALAAQVDVLLALPADPELADCCFIEDTMLVIGDTVVLCHLQAPTRRPETRMVQQYLHGLAVNGRPLTLKTLEFPAFLDGGDVLVLGDEIYVGLSSRSNQEAVNSLQRLLPRCRVHGLKVAGALHLKSLVTALGPETIVAADNEGGRFLAQAITRLNPRPLATLFVPDQLAANVLQVGTTTFIQAGFPRSEALIRAKAQALGYDCQVLAMSEFAKVDGALTCCSVLFT